MPKPKRKISKQPAQTVRVTKEESSPALFPVLFLILLLAFCATTITFPYYVWLNPLHYVWRLPFPSWLTAFILFFLMFAAAKLGFKGSSPLVDLPPFWTRVGLFVVLALATFLCLHHMNVLPDYYGEDVSYCVYEPLRMKDLSDYLGTFVYQKGLLPIWPYTVLLLWRLMPDLHTLAVQRLANSIFDIGALIVIYQIGKEIAGRRMGLYCAAVVSVAKPMLYKVVSGYSYSIFPFAMALVIWGTFRLSRKDSRHSFMWWGILVGLSAYSCYPIQPFVVSYIFGTLLLVWWDNRDQMNLRNSNVWVWGSALVFAVYGLYCTGSLPLDIWIGTSLINSLQPIISVICFAAALGLIIAYLRGKLQVDKKDLWHQWVFGAWLAALISFAGLTHPNIIGRIRAHGLGLVGGETDYLSWAYLAKAFNHLPETLQSMFWQYQDRADMSIMNDPYFSYSEMILIALGLIFCLVKPNSKRIFIVLAAMVGLVPNFFASMVHSGLLLGCLIPFWLIMAIGVNDLTEMVLTLGRSRKVWVPLLVALVLFWGWSARTLFSRVYTQWAESNEDNIIFREEAMSDMSNPDNRVYFASHLFLTCAWTDFEFEGYPFHYLDDGMSPIDIGPGEKTPNVIVYIDGFDDINIAKKIAAAYPDAHWTIPLTPLFERGIYVQRCEIPAADIQSGKSNILTAHPVRGDFWKRTWGQRNMGLNFSAITWQDEAADPNAPTPKDTSVNDEENLKMQSTIHVGQDGQYEVTCGTANRTILSIDGKKQFDMSFPRIVDPYASPRTEKATVNLEKGDHSVELVTYFQYGNQLPIVTLKPKGTPGDGKSLWSGFTF